MTSADPAMRWNEFANLATETLVNETRATLGQPNCFPIKPDVPFYSWTTYRYTYTSETLLTNRIATFARKAQQLCVGLELIPPSQNHPNPNLLITRKLPNGPVERFTNTKSLEKALLKTLQENLTDQYWRAETQKKKHRRMHFRQDLLLFGPFYNPHTGVMSNRCLWDLAYHQRHTDLEIKIFLRMRTNATITPILRKARGEKISTQALVCPYPQCQRPIGVTHLLNNRHIFPSNSPPNIVKLVNQVKNARHKDVITLLHEHVTKKLRRGCFFVTGDQMHSETVQPLVSNHPVDTQIRNILLRGGARHPDLLYRVDSPSVGSHLVWIEFTSTSDKHIFLQEQAFTSPDWRRTVAQYQNDAKHRLSRPFEPTECPYTMWMPDGPKAGYRTPRTTPQYPFPHWFTTEVPFSPRAKILHRTIRKRRDLLRTTNLITHMVIIEIGPRAYVSLLSIEEMQAHIKPIIPVTCSVKRIITELVESITTNTIKAGLLMKEWGMF